MVLGIVRHILASSARANCKVKYPLSFCVTQKRLPERNLGVAWFSSKILKAMEDNGIVPDVIDTVPPYTVEVWDFFFFKYTLNFHLSDSRKMLSNYCRMCHLVLVLLNC